MTQWQTSTNKICITAHNHDPVYFGITFDIDIYQPKQSKTATPSINEPKSETLNVIGAVVIDIHRRTQTENTLFDHFFHCHFRCCILKTTTFFSLSSLTCINNYSTHNTENFTVWFIDTHLCFCRLFCFIHINSKDIISKYTESSLCDVTKILFVVVWYWDNTFWHVQQLKPVLPY